MALTRRMLKAMGIEADAIEQIIDAHTETVDALKQQRDTFKEEADDYKEKLVKANESIRESDAKRKEAEDENARLTTQSEKEHAELEKLRKSSEETRAEFDSYRQETEAKDLTRRKSKAFRQLLADAGIAHKYVEAVLGVSKMDDIELDDDGGIKNADAIAESVKKAYPEFVSRVETRGTNPETPPQNKPVNDGVSKIARGAISQYYEHKYGIKEGEAQQ